MNQDENQNSPTKQLYHKTMNCRTIFLFGDLQSLTDSKICLQEIFSRFKLFVKIHFFDRDNPSYRRKT